jgi:hypothetical protein
VVDINASKDI